MSNNKKKKTRISLQINVFIFIHSSVNLTRRELKFVYEFAYGVQRFVKLEFIEFEVRWMVLTFDLMRASTLS